MQLQVNLIWVVPILATWVMAGAGGRLLAHVHNNQRQTGERQPLAEAACVGIIFVATVLSACFGWFLLEEVK